MEETTLEIFESYFKNDNWRLSLGELSSHNCCFCQNSSKKIKIIYHCKLDMVKFIMTYLNHLKVYGCSWKKVKYFINSIKLSKFCDDNITGKWLLEYWYEKDIYILLCI